MTPPPSEVGAGPHDPAREEAAVARIVHRELTGLAAAVPVDVLKTLDTSKILAAFDWMVVAERLMGIGTPLERIILDAARDELEPEQLRKDVTAAIDFTLIDQLAVSYAAQHSGRLAIEISTKMRLTIAAVTAELVAGGMTPAAAVSMLTAAIPLHEAWALSTVRAGIRARNAAIAAGKTVEQAERAGARVTANRAKALTRRRAQNIARTESMTAVHEGKYAGWNQQVANGWVSPDSLKEWREGRDPCDRCAPFVGVIVRWDEPFPNGHMMPPEHPSCRCTAGLLPPDPEFLEIMARQRAEGRGVSAG
jgi:hypothetical protein